MTEFAPSDHSRIRRMAERGHYDRETIYSVVDEALVSHVGIVDHGRPVIIPMYFGRDGDTLYFHGSRGSRIIRHMAQGNDVCATFTLIDDFVMARSAFHHSMNYRSVVLFGAGREITDMAEKTEVLQIITDRLFPGRWGDVRPPTDKELEVTGVIAVDIVEASAKIRTGDPIDEPEDVDLPIWAGLLPTQQMWGVPTAAANLNNETPLPDYLASYAKGY